MGQKHETDGLSIVIPLYNEVDNVDSLFDKITGLYSKARFKKEIILVDGCSNDGTQEKIKSQLSDSNLDGLKFIPLNSKNGYGSDIVEGLKSAKYEFLAWTHADLQTDLEDLITAYDLIENKDKFIIKGSRVGRPVADRFLTFCMKLVVMFYLGTNLSDINAQPKIFTRDFFEKHILDNYPDDFSLDLFLLINAKLNGYKIKSFPVYFEKRQYGEAKGGGGSLLNKLILIRRTFKYIRSLRKRF